MTEEEKEAILILDTLALNGLSIPITEDMQKDFKTVLNIIQKQREEIEKLRNKNKDLLRKLRNRVKEVKKLSKYSLYKEEFAKLNREIAKKDKMIDEISENPYNELKVKGILFTGTDIKQYFERKVEEV